MRPSGFDDLPEGLLANSATALGWNWQPLPSIASLQSGGSGGRRTSSEGEASRTFYGRVSPTPSAGRVSPVQVLGGFTAAPTAARRARGKAPETDATERAAPPSSPTPAAKATVIVTPTDPHPHPAAMPSPPHALDVYRLAHRCELTALASLALDHLVQTLTPKTAFPLLLVSYLWPELHEAVQVRFPFVAMLRGNKRDSATILPTGV